MNLETLREFCLALPAVTEDVKWEDHLCFSVGEKMFAIASMSVPFTVSFKVAEEEFEELTQRQGIVPAPYLARYKWALVQQADCLSAPEWEHYVRQSYELVKSKLPKKVLKAAGLV